MATEAKEAKELNIQEENDGSAVVELPEGADFQDEGENSSSDSQEPVEKADGGAVDEEEDHPDDTEAVRAARRARRKAKKSLIRKTNEEKDLRLMQLQRESEELKRRLLEVEHRTKRSDIIQADKIIEDHQVRLEYAKMKLREAANSNDGDALVEAQEMWRSAERELERAMGYKQNLERQTRQDVNIPDARIQRNAATWMERNPWYRPDASDTDSKIAKQIDEALSAEGWNATDPDYWDELDSRLQKYLPHRYNANNRDERISAGKPRNVVGSSGREASGAYGGSNKSTFTLSPERVKAMKDAGAWDNPVRKEAMIKNFMAYDRANRK